mgnify:CR=1 FL=1
MEEVKQSKIKILTKGIILENPLFDKICEELDIPFHRIGSLTVAIEENQLPLLNELKITEVRLLQ